jgi:hypothetical protein
LTQNPQRYSGRELALLLAQVRDELGEDATIVEANRIREGGIGGFFAKERFEVVAAAGTGIDADHPPRSGTGPGRDDPAPAPSEGRAPGTASGSAGHLGGLLDRAEQVSAAERGGPAGCAAPASSEARFQEILRTALSDLDAAIPASGEPDPIGPAGGHWPPGPATAPPPPPRPLRAPQPPPAAAPPADLDRGGPAPVMPTALAAAPAGREQLRALPAGRFWEDLLRFEGLVDESPLTVPLTVVVGPLDDAVAVARQLGRAGGTDRGDLVVVTDRPAVDGIPPWQVVDGRDGLVERVRYWRGEGRRAMVVVDLSPDERGRDRAARLVAAAGADLTRLVVRTLDDPAALAATIRALGPVGAIDLSRPPEPAALVALVERGVRVGTVCGRPLTALLLAGLAGHAHG